MKSDGIPFSSNNPNKVSIADRVFRKRGENEYSLELLPAGVTLYINRLRRSSHELHAELTVSITNGHFRTAKTIDGILSSADINLSSAQTRTSRAKLLADRVGTDGEHLDWSGFIEELSIKTIAAERVGDPAVDLFDVQPTETDKSTWEFDGFPVLRRHPTVLFGKGGSGKSYFVMWIAGLLAKMGVHVAYFDWELSKEDHEERLARLFQPKPKGIHYINCRQPLREDKDRVQRLIREHGCTFGVFDSIGPAARAGGGRFQDGDLGQEYFGLVRQLGIGSLHVAHPPKHVDDEKDATIYGSAFFDYLARSVWFVQATENPPKGEMIMGLYHQKHTTGAKLAPRAYRLLFSANQTQIQSTDLKEIDELVAKLPILERMKQLLVSNGPMKPAALAEELGVKVNIVRAMVSRHKSVFKKLGLQVGLHTLSTDLEF